MASIYRPKYRTASGETREAKIWRGRVFHEGRKLTRSLDTTSRPVAKERLQEWLDELRSSGWQDRKTYRFIDAALKFVDEHFPRIKPSSAQRYAVSLAALRPHFEHLDLHQITSGPISDFEVSRRAAGVSNGTIRRDISCLAAMFRCAEEWEWHAGNPAAAYLRNAVRRGLTEAPARQRYLSHEEEATILAAVDEKIGKASSDRARHGARMLKAAIVLAIDTGLRREELMGLPWANVDFTGKPEIEVTAERAKSSRMRRVPILPRSCRLLDEMAATSRSRFVLHTLAGKRYSDLTQAFDRLTAKLGMVDLRWHDLRRTCGCRLLQDLEMPMERVSKWLGHSSIDQTQRAYAFLEVRHLHASLERSHAQLERYRAIENGHGTPALGSKVLDTTANIVEAETGANADD